MKSDTLCEILLTAMTEYGDDVDHTDDLELHFILHNNVLLIGTTHHGFIYDDFVLIQQDQGFHAVCLENIQSIAIKDPRLKKTNE